MCGLFGFVNYSGKEIKNLSDLTNSLAEQSAIRGTDATGIAFCNSNGIKIVKENKSAYSFEVKHSDGLKSLTGHTRHGTQGSEKRNCNNHPFFGKCKNSSFAFSHNGVLSNDKTLRKKYNLPKTKIETDSYIGVQLIESQRVLDFKSIKYMAEKTEGSFSYSILDDKNNIYLVKGDSPLSILHFTELKLYVYASTEEILYKALVDVPLLFKALKKGEFEEVYITEGDILKICSNGDLKKGYFEYKYYYGRSWWDYDYFPSTCYGSQAGYSSSDYIEDLKSVASYQGYSPDEIDELVIAGFSLDEIEEYLYCGCGGEW